MDISKTTVKVNDFVWAKLARYPPWPAIVMKPDPKAPVKHKNSQWIYFFGSHDYAWVEERHIKPFRAFKDQFTATNKRADLLEAVEEAEEIIENVERDPDYEIQFIKYTRKERKRSVSRSRKSSESSVGNRKKLKKETAKFTPSRRGRASVSADTDSDDKEDFITEMRNPTSISPKTFGFLAANIFDEGILKNLIKSGHRTQVWSSSLAMCEELEDYAQRQGAYFKICRTRRELVRNCDIIFNHQTDPEQVKLLLKEFGVHNEDDNLLDGKGYVEMTCIDPDTSSRHCKLIENKGATYIEAMLQGNVSEANRGELLVITAGKMPPFTECSSCFKAMSRSTIFLENIGSATKSHLLVEGLRGVILAGFAEFCALADKWGVDLSSFIRLLDHTSMACAYFKGKEQMITHNKFTETEEPLQIMQRNLSQVRESSNTLRHPIPLAANAYEILKHARRLGYDNQDAACIYNRTRY